MSWPLASHFSAMVQNPRIAFRDPNLQSCRVEKDERNQPRPWAGQFAVVYKAYSAERNEPFAVRVFTTESPERRERYHLTSAYLATRKLGCLVEFEYRDRSIRSAGDGKWYPMILMEWVQGDTLFQWTRARCRVGDAPALAKAAERWLELVKELGEAGVAHGDLQHANVMVTPAGELKLVDYDCLCVPALVGRRNLEIGVEPYQHPGRNERTLLSLDLDHFSALVIYVALRALAVDPRLWQRYVEDQGYDKLLFRRDDFAAPAASSLYRDLTQLPDSELADLAGQLMNLYRAPIDQVPPLGNLVNNYAKVEELLRRGQWEEAVRLLNRRGQFRDAPEALRPLIHHAYEQVCRQEAWRALQRVARETNETNDRALVQAWNESLLSGFEPAERERIRVGAARRRVQLVDRLRYVVQQASGVLTAAGEQAIVEAADQLPGGYRHGLVRRVEQARRRASAIARLGRALKEQVSEAGIIAAWRAVCEAGCEAVVDAYQRSRIELAERRAPALAPLVQMPGDLPADRRDQRILELWNEALLGDCREAARFRAEYERALGRRDAVASLRSAVERGDDAAVVAAAADPALAGFPMPRAWAERIAAARHAAERAEAMLAALAEGHVEALGERFDARAVRFDPERFAPYRDQLARWVEAELSAPEAVGLALPESGEPVEPLDDPPGGFRLRWTWPAARYAERCVLGIAARDPRDGDRPEDAALQARFEIDQAQWHSAGDQWTLMAEAEWKGGRAAVWALVDLGFETVAAGPLRLGPLREPSRWNWRKWSLFGGARRGAADAKSQAAEPLSPDP